MEQKILQPQLVMKHFIEPQFVVLSKILSI